MKGINIIDINHIIKLINIIKFANEIYFKTSTQKSSGFIRLMKRSEFRA